MSAGLTALGAVILTWRRRAPLRTAAAIAALGVVTLVITGTLNGYDLAIFALATIAIGSDVRIRRVRVAALVDSANRLTVERDQEVRLAAAAERAREAVAELSTTAARRSRTCGACSGCSVNRRRRSARSRAHPT